MKDPLLYTFRMTDSSTYLRRRILLGNTYSRTLFVIPSGDEAKRSHSVKFRFKPAADFSYLCGLHLSGSFLIILGSQTYLLQDTPHDQIWGEHTALASEDAPRLEGIILEPVSRMEDIILDLVGQFDRIAISLSRDQRVEDRLLSIISYDRRSRDRLRLPITLSDSRLLVGTIRLNKDEGEVAALKEASLRTSRVHRNLMRQPLIGKSERQVSNWVEAGFLMEDMQWISYETVVGAGDRSTILHARATDQIIKKDDWILIDAGGEWDGYCADVTRAFPANSVFTRPQRSVYSIVLEAQKLVIRSVRPGQTLQELHGLATQSLIEGLMKAGHSEEVVRTKMNHLMPHSTSHWIGMDVHDPCPHLDDNGQALRLSPGMTFTVEPGLYFRERDEFREYLGIGVRIEDDVVVTEKGCEQLSSVPKEIEEIEQLRRDAF